MTEQKIEMSEIELKQKFQEALDKIIHLYLKLIFNPENIVMWDGYGEYKNCSLCVLSNKTYKTDCSKLCPLYLFLHKNCDDNASQNMEKIIDDIQHESVDYNHKNDAKVIYVVMRRLAYIILIATTNNYKINIDLSKLKKEN